MRADNEIKFGFFDKGFGASIALFLLRLELFIARRLGDDERLVPITLSIIEKEALKAYAGVEQKDNDPLRNVIDLLSQDEVQHEGLLEASKHDGLKSYKQLQKSILEFSKLIENSTNQQLDQQLDQQVPVVLDPLKSGESKTFGSMSHETLVFDNRLILMNNLNDFLARLQDNNTFRKDGKIVKTNKAELTTRLAKIIDNPCLDNTQKELLKDCCEQLEVAAKGSRSANVNMKKSMNALTKKNTLINSVKNVINSQQQPDSRPRSNADATGDFKRYNGPN